LLPAERAYRDIGGTQEVAGRRDAQFVTTGHDIGPNLFAEPDFVANLVFQGRFVRNNAGFVRLIYHGVPYDIHDKVKQGSPGSS
jgi:hypothetical protein